MNSTQDPPDGPTPMGSETPEMPRRFVILDRDGTINEERYYLSNPEDVVLLPGVLEGLRSLRALGLGLVVVTNQSAIGREYFDAKRLDEIHLRLQGLLAEGGVTLDRIYTCPHLPEEACACRKPRPGLVLRAEKDFHFDSKEAIVIGDKACDVLLSKNLGSKTILVTTGYGAHVAQEGTVEPDFIAENLSAAAHIVEDLLKAEPRSTGHVIDPWGTPDD